MRLRVGKEYSSALKFSVWTTGIWFVMDFYKDKAKLIDKLLEEGPTSTEEEDEALVTLKRESHMRNKFFACHVVVLVLVVVLGMYLFARVACYGFQTTEYDKQSLNGGLFILILGHFIYCRLPLYWRYFYIQRYQPRFFNTAILSKIFPLSRNPARFHRSIPILVASFTGGEGGGWIIYLNTIWGGALVETVGAYLRGGLMYTMNLKLSCFQSHP